MKKIQEEYLILLNENGFCSKEHCSKEENETFSKMKNNSEELPEDVIYYDSIGFARMNISDLNDEKIKIHISLKQTQHLKTIKNCLIYFVTLSTISIIIGIIIGLGLIK